MKKAHDSDLTDHRALPVPTASDLVLCPSCLEAYTDPEQAAECCNLEQVGWLLNHRKNSENTPCPQRAGRI